MTTIRIATADGSLRAVVTARRSLRYAGGSDDHADRPAHVRAASSLAWIDDQIALVQDDTNFVALVDPRGGDVRAVALPRGEGGMRQFGDARGNKQCKLDLEACVSVTDDHGPTLLAFGSGSTQRRRQVATIDRWHLATPRVQVADATSLYKRLEAERAFAGSDMNIEGVIVVENVLRFFGRGNGTARGDLIAVNATCDVPLDALREFLRNPASDTSPDPTAVVQYQLGALDGIALGFTDATVFGETMLYSATAEASANATVDGPVTGSVLGTVSRRGIVRYAAITDETGLPFREKVEGVLLSRTLPRHAYIVIDGDDATRPSELCDVELIGSWTD